MTSCFSRVFHAQSVCRGEDPARHGAGALAGAGDSRRPRLHHHRRVRRRMQQPAQASQVRRK